MDTDLTGKRLARTSLVLGLVGWFIYLGQWCFDLSLGLILAAATAGTSAACSTVLDVLPFVLWVIGIVSGHAALSQARKDRSTGRSAAVWGLVLNYSGLFFFIILLVAVVVLLVAGVHSGWFSRMIPFLHH